MSKNYRYAQTHIWIELVENRDEDEERGREDKIIEERVGRDERVGQDRIGRDERVGQERVGRDERVGQEERVGVSDPQQAVRKGVLWQQRDRLFSRWKVNRTINNFNKI